MNGNHEKKLPIHEPRKHYSKPSLSRAEPRSAIAYVYWRTRRLLTRPLLWVLVILITLAIWWTGGAGPEVTTAEIHARLKDLLPPGITKDLKFFPASHHKIHVRGILSSHCLSLSLTNFVVCRQMDDGTEPLADRWCISR